MDGWVYLSTPFFGLGHLYSLVNEMLVDVSTGLKCTSKVGLIFLSTAIAVRETCPRYLLSLQITYLSETHCEAFLSWICRLNQFCPSWLADLWVRRWIFLSASEILWLFVMQRFCSKADLDSRCSINISNQWISGKLLTCIGRLQSILLNYQMLYFETHTVFLLRVYY